MKTHQYDTAILGENIRNLRKSMPGKNRWMRQGVLAKKLGLGSKTVQRWERGYTVPSTDRLIRLANALGVTVDGLLRGKRQTAGRWKKSNYDLDKLGQHIRQIRRSTPGKKGCIKQQELADMIGLGERSIRRWEKGISAPDSEKIIALAQALNVTIDRILLGDPDEKKKKRNLKNVGANIKMIRTVPATKRKIRTISQRLLAEKSGIDVEVLRLWERGMAIPKMNDVNKLATALGVAKDDLLLGIVEKNFIPRDQTKIAGNIRRFRHYPPGSKVKKCMKQKDFAERVGVDPVRVRFWEAGTKVPTRKQVEKIASVFGVKSEELYK